jgi:flagellar biosynthesis/type III secretory pathway chaperone
MSAKELLDNREEIKPSEREPGFRPELASDLANVMDEILEAHKGLAGAARAKKDCVINNDVNGVKQITEREKDLLAFVSRLEKTRLALVGEVARCVDKSESGITLSAIAEIMPEGRQRTRLLETASEMRRCMSELKTLNEQNWELIKNALDYIDFSVNLMRGSQEDDGLYSQTEKFSRPMLLDIRN